MKTNIFQMSAACCWNSTVPSPYAEALLEVFVGRDESYNACVVGVASSDMIATLIASTCGLKSARIG